jgi:hypothetical protein
VQAKLGEVGVRLRSGELDLSGIALEAVVGLAKALSKRRVDRGGIILQVSRIVPQLRGTAQESNRCESRGLGAAR